VGGSTLFSVAGFGASRATSIRRGNVHSIAATCARIWRPFHAAVGESFQEVGFGQWRVVGIHARTIEAASSGDKPSGQRIRQRVQHVDRVTGVELRAIPHRCGPRMEP
jgi:hypothetical protein